MLSISHFCLRTLKLQQSEDRDPITPASTEITYLKVPASRGSIWLSRAYRLFVSSPGVWFGIAGFLMVMLMLPFINHLVAILMPVLIGGLMLGCHKQSKTSPIKFEHLFEGLKSNTKELLLLSAFYAGLSVLISLATFYIMLMFGVNIEELIANLVPKTQTVMTQEQALEWMQGLERDGILMKLLLALLIFLALMIPLFMAFWFAPALVVLNKASAAQALKISYLACKDNFVAFLIYGLVAFVYLIAFFVIISILMILIQPIAIILIFVGYLAIFAITLISIYTAYLDIFNPESNLSDDQLNESDSSMLA